MFDFNKVQHWEVRFEPNQLTLPLLFATGRHRVLSPPPPEKLLCMTRGFFCHFHKKVKVEVVPPSRAGGGAAPRHQTLDVPLHLHDEA